jgi:Family of unknown function (DUF6084)
MPDLTFEIAGAEAIRDVATPTLAFHLRATNRMADEPIHAVLLRCQIQIEAPRRRYNLREQEQLRDLFGESSRWGQTLRPLLWVNTCVNLPAFTGSIVHPLPVPCTFDLNIATAKYFHALEDGEIPITFLFSGTVFYDSGQGRFQVAPISWNQEARFRLSAQTWKEMMDLHYPNMAWLCLRRDVFDELHRFKVREGIPTFEEALERMLSIAEEGRPVS